MESLSFDTIFLIDFQKERKAKQKGKAHVFLENHASKAAYLSVIAYGEYAEGFENLSDPAFVSVVESFEILPVTRRAAGLYGRIVRLLRSEGDLSVPMTFGSPPWQWKTKCRSSLPTPAILAAFQSFKLLVTERLEQKMSIRSSVASPTPVRPSSVMIATKVQLVRQASQTRGRRAVIITKAEKRGWRGNAEACRPDSRGTILGSGK